MIVTALLCASGIAQGAQEKQEKPEITRQAASPQAVGVLHTMRTIPETCSRAQGQFTGNAAQPYQLEVVQSSSQCRPRALLQDAGVARPSAQTGWLLNDIVRVPSAACPSQQAVLRVWRHPGKVAPPKLDAQGRSRIYLQDAMNDGPSPDVPKFALDFRIEGKACD
ncbi:hypothetical protein CO608_08095 [Lysobacteraceae bacterium NML08-0793]|nr:hypothetical protein CO608_08095 [Xanthomonadaceae bacterium NML08-0793]